jgi:hypothetical protein
MSPRSYILPVAIFLACWIVLAATTPGIPIVWDEGEYLRRAGLVADWFRLLFGAAHSTAGSGAFSTEAITAHWLFIDYSEGHPAWFILPIALSRSIFERALDPLTAARLGPVTVFSVACAFVAFRAEKEWGNAAAIIAPLALITFPRVFSEAHFATQDGQLTAWWLMLWAVDAPLGAQARDAAGTGVLLGLVTATKFTGWLAWIPVIASRIAQRVRWSLQTLTTTAIIMAMALVVFFVVNPPLWHHPVDGLLSHFHRSLDRAHTFSIAILFLGRVYDMQHPLPWYNTLVWLMIVTPLPTLVLGAIGLWRCVKAHRQPASLTLVLHWLTLMVVRALPAAPPHDGIRLFLPAFGFWCVFAGIGAQHVWNLAAGSSARSQWLLVRAILVASLVGACINVARYFPQTLSHYNVLAGGVRGASSLGMEPAYWWDGLDNDVLGWLNEHTEPSAAVAFSTVSNMTELHAWHRLRPRDVDPAKELFKWYVLQNRPGMFNARDRALVRRAEPAYVKYAGRRKAGQPVPADLNVPLIMIYSYDQYQRAR